MRIISGTHKGRRIVAPRRLPVRPTTDMAKEALFNILANTFHFEGISVLDLYSGTGSISYEFASRGCNRIVAVDASIHCVKFIKTTSAALNIPISVFQGDVLSFLSKTTEAFDVIFADPPYGQPLEYFVGLRELVFENELLREGGLLVIEHSSHTDLSTLEFFEVKRKYGGSIFSFFQKEGI